jgi:hypothetical protein
VKRAEEFVYRAVEEGLFEIDSEGRIWRVARHQVNRWDGAVSILPCKRRRAEGNKKGRYLQVRVTYGGVLGIVSAHRLIWYHLHGRVPDELTINHKDGKKHNNHPDNLELATRVEQMQHAMRVLGHKPFAKGRYTGGTPGEKSGLAKLTNKAVRYIRRSRKSGVELVRQFSVSPATISRVRNNVLWRHI